MTTRPDAVVLPSKAIQTGLQGLFVFVIKTDMTVESRPVAVTMTLGNETVIDSGVLPVEQVVTMGNLGLFAAHASRFASWRADEDLCPLHQSVGHDNLDHDLGAAFRYHGLQPSTGGALVPLDAVSTITTGFGLLTVNYSGQLSAVTVWFNLKPGYALGNAVEAISFSLRR